MKEFMVASVDRYIMYLRKKSNGIFTFTSELNAANRVLNDKLVIQEFFESHMIIDELENIDGEQEGDGYVRSNMREVRDMRLLIETNFESMIHLACIISARHPSAVEVDVRALYKKWGLDGKILMGFIKILCVFIWENMWVFDYFDGFY